MAARKSPPGRERGRHASAKAAEGQDVPPGFVPLIDVSGDAVTCGRALGWAWLEALRLAASAVPADARPWWRRRPFGKLVERRAAYLPDLYRGMAEGAGLDASQLVAQGITPIDPPSAGCTAFAIQPAATAMSEPISGQTKDTGADRAFRYQVLRMRIDGGPSHLTLTYPGWVFGHGFVTSGCSILRNALYAGCGQGELTYSEWGLLALHCPTADEAVSLALRHGVAGAGHCVAADEKGNVAGIEFGKGGVGVLKPRGGLYVHANRVMSGKRLGRHEVSGEPHRESSLHRQERLRGRLEADRGRLTAQLAFMALADHDGHPNCICRHGPGDVTSAAVVVEPTRGLLHVCRGTPCRNWPRTYSLAQ